ncbi:MAG: NAD-dependent epimerase/dehydratase family protein [Myxococcota bacterium]
MAVDVITGATGQVGMELVAALLAAGDSVRAVTLPGDAAAAGLRERGVEVVEADVRDAAAMQSVMQGARYVYHLAAIVSTTATHDLRMWQINVEGVRNVADAARQAGVERMVYFSSIVVFDQEPLEQPLDERRPRLAPADGSPYVRSKIVGEQVLREAVAAGLDAVVVHPTVVIGAHENHHVGVVKTLFYNYFAGKLPAVFAGGFNSVAATDVAEGAMAAARRGRCGESYILGGQWHSVLELLRRAKKVSGAAVPRVAIPLPLARAGAPIVDAVARLTATKPAYTDEDIRQLAGNPHICCGKAERELGYRPLALDAALQSVHRQWLASR